ncbi:MAG: UDP-N-acetylmuramoyl-L-alanyl-D-glutamate--2,6-diaminopimelate ligase [Actinomycetota bacterium]
MTVTPDSSSPVALSRLASACGDALMAVDGDPATEVTGVTLDSRAAGVGDLFFCVPGHVTDGHQFAPNAVAGGAAALVVERPLRLGVPEVLVTSARVAMARMGAAFYGRPADGLLLLGVTGTSGKTTTAYLLEPILAAAGYTTGLIGTIETRIGGVARVGARTTPDSLDLQRLFAEMRAAGVGAVAMEVSSHALALHRVEGVRFTAAGFMNLSQDHLDFHAGMQDYFAAKRSLFVPGRVVRGAINVDDAYGRKIKESSEVDVIGFGIASDADVRPEGLRRGPWGQEFVALTPAGEMKITTQLVGDFNLSNCLAAIAIALQADIAPAAIESGLAGVKSVPGRFEGVDCGQPFAVVVDYSHKPGALDNVLREARRMSEPGGGRVICVFGCGGDRDRAKRPLMGRVAARLADVVVVTSDNPRGEDPEAIVAAILEGVAAERAEGADHIIIDRREAITTAIEQSRAGDVVVIAGKGHETGQAFADHTAPFDDREVARAALKDGGWTEAC